MTTFGKHSTADEVLNGIDLAGKTVFITGGNSGLGKESARAMATHGAHVIIAGRDQGKLDAAVAEMTAAHADARIDTIICDLASLESVRTGAVEACERFAKIDILINNAGVMASPMSYTADGFEMQFGTNHIGHFALTEGLMPLIEQAAKSSGSARIVNLSSRGHFIANVDLDDPNFEHRDYNEWVSYGQAKTANVLFTIGLERRFSGRGIHSLAVHPGGIRTNLSRHLDDAQEQALMDRVMTSDPDFEWKTEAQGAATQVWAATSPALDGMGGRYCEDCHLAEVDDHSTRGGVRSYAIDPERAERLWTLSEKMSGEPFPA